jgi:hypothetical protein
MPMPTRNALARMRNHQAAHQDDHRRDPIAEFPEMGQGLQPALDHLLNGHDAGSGEHGRDLLHHVVDGAVLAQGRHFDHGDAPRLVQGELGRGEVREDELIVLGSRRLQNAGHGQVPPLHAEVAPDPEPEHPSRLRTQEDALVHRQSPLDLPPGLEDLGGGEVHPGEEHLPPGGVHRPQDHRPQGRDVPRILDRLDLLQVAVAELLHLEGNPAQGKSAIGEGEVLGLRHDQDVRPVLFQLVVDVLGDGSHQAHQGYDRGNADQEPGQDEGGLGLPAPEVEEGDIAKCSDPDQVAQLQHEDADPEHHEGDRDLLRRRRIEDVVHHSGVGAQDRSGHGDGQTPAEPTSDDAHGQNAVDEDLHHEGDNKRRALEHVPDPCPVEEDLGRADGADQHHAVQHAGDTSEEGTRKWSWLECDAPGAPDQRTDDNSHAKYFEEEVDPAPRGRPHR